MKQISDTKILRGKRSQEYEKRENQQDATIRCLLSTSVSTCFRHYCIWCTALVLLNVVGSGCGALRCRVRAL